MINQNRTRRRQLKTRSRLKENIGIPRLTIHRTNTHIYAQIIDDRRGLTLVSASSLTLAKKLSKTDQASAVGEAIGNLAKEKNIGKIRFDRGSYRYHGRVKRLADSARSTGLKF